MNIASPMKPMIKRNRPTKFVRMNNRQYSARSMAAQRNTLTQAFEKYLTLAREASSSGDKIVAENYYQYAEHYLRTLNEMVPIDVDSEIGDSTLSKDGDGYGEPDTGSHIAMTDEEAYPF